MNSESLLDSESFPHSNEHESSMMMETKEKLTQSQFTFKTVSIYAADYAKRVQRKKKKIGVVGVVWVYSALRKDRGDFFARIEEEAGKKEKGRPHRNKYTTVVSEMPKTATCMAGCSFISRIQDEFIVIPSTFKEEDPRIKGVVASISKLFYFATFCISILGLLSGKKVKVGMHKEKQMQYIITSFMTKMDPVGELCRLLNPIAKSLTEYHKIVYDEKLMRVCYMSDLERKPSGPPIFLVDGPNLISCEGLYLSGVRVLKQVFRSIPGIAVEDRNCHTRGFTFLIQFESLKGCENLHTAIRIKSKFSNLMAKALLDLGKEYKLSDSQREFLRKEEALGDPADTDIPERITYLVKEASEKDRSFKLKFFDGKVVTVPKIYLLDPNSMTMKN